MTTTYSTDNSRVSSVWSAYGHRFMDDGGENTVSCLTCGAVYQLLAFADDPTRGEYLTAAGEPPADCTGDTSMVHGYPGERFCHEHTEARGDECEHTRHDCPCIACG
jgi:hypothetical protein